MRSTVASHLMTQRQDCRVDLTALLAAETSCGQRHSHHKGEQNSCDSNVWPPDPRRHGGDPRRYRRAGTSPIMDDPSASFLFVYGACWVRRRRSAIGAVGVPRSLGSEWHAIVKREGLAPARARYFVVPQKHVVAAAWIAHKKPVHRSNRQAREAQRTTVAGEWMRRCSRVTTISGNWWCPGCAVAPDRVWAQGSGRV